MTFNLLYKVGKNKMYKTYTRGEYGEVLRSFKELKERAANKNFKMISHAGGNMGVELCYTDGKQYVYLLVCTENERKMWWLGRIAN